MSVYSSKLVSLLVEKNYDLNFIEVCHKVFNSYPEKPDGHSQDHILEVVMRVLDYMDYYTLTKQDKEIIVMGAICHDLGLINGARHNHHIRSASLVGLDTDIVKYFKDDVFVIHKIMECCLYHRSSNSTGASIPFYAELVADADNDLSYISVINRIITVNGYKYLEDDTDITTPILEKLIKDGIHHIEEKFTRDGYQDFFLIHKLPHIQKVLEARYDFFDDKEQTYELFLFSLKKYFNI